MHCRLIDLLGEVESCLDTTVLTLTMEREVWLPPADSPSNTPREKGQREERRHGRDAPKFETKKGKCFEWTTHGTCPNFNRCPWRVSHTNANRSSRSRATGDLSPPLLHFLPGQWRSTAASRPPGDDINAAPGNNLGMDSAGPLAGPLTSRRSWTPRRPHHGGT